MRKILLTGLFFIFICTNVGASEITEDYFDMASNYAANGNYKDAAAYLDKILLLEPQNGNVKDLRDGLRQLMQGANKSFILQKSNAVKQAVEAKKNGNKQGELNALAAGNDYWANYFLGQYYKQNKEYNKAIECFIKSVNTQTNFTQCYLEIALCYYEMANYPQAIVYLNQYLNINQQDDFAYALRARTNANLNKLDLALSDIITAIALENSVDYRLLEGKILYMMKRYSQAKTKLEGLKDEVQTADLYKYIGLCEAELGNDADAIINLEKSILLFEDDKTVNSKYNEIKNRIENET